MLCCKVKVSVWTNSVAMMVSIAGGSPTDNNLGGIELGELSARHVLTAACFLRFTCCLHGAASCLNQHGTLVWNSSLKSCSRLYLASCPEMLAGLQS